MMDHEAILERARAGRPLTWGEYYPPAPKERAKVLGMDVWEVPELPVSLAIASPAGVVVIAQDGQMVHLDREALDALRG